MTKLINVFDFMLSATCSKAIESIGRIFYCSAIVCSASTWSTTLKSASVGLEPNIWHLILSDQHRRFGIVVYTINARTMIRKDISVLQNLQTIYRYSIPKLNHHTGSIWRITTLFCSFSSDHFLHKFGANHNKNLLAPGRLYSWMSTCQRDQITYIIFC